MQTIKIMNTEARVHTIAYAYAKVAGGAGTRGVSFRLLPGLNEVPLHAWEQAKEIDVVRSMLRLGLLQEAGVRESGIDGLDEDEAIEVVRQTLDRELLRGWRRDDKRRRVLTALDEQIDAVTFNPERDAKKPDDDFDMKPRPIASGFDGAEIASQVQTGLQPIPDEERLRPMHERESDRASRGPVVPPAAITSQLRDVEAVKLPRSVSEVKRREAKGFEAKSKGKKK